MEREHVEDVIAALNALQDVLNNAEVPRWVALAAGNGVVTFFEQAAGELMHHRIEIAADVVEDDLKSVGTRLTVGPRKIRYQVSGTGSVGDGEVWALQTQSGPPIASR